MDYALLILLSSASVGGEERTVNAMGMWGLRERLVLPAEVERGVLWLGRFRRSLTVKPATELYVKGSKG